MYNYQTYLKEQAIAERCQHIRREHSQASLHRQQVNSKLAHSHQKRVEAFVLAVLQKPIAVQQYHNSPHAFRPEDNSKNISADGFYLRHENQASRIEQSLKRNGELDQVPFSNTFSHRFRETAHLCKPMKYRAVNQHFRIKEQLERQPLNYLSQHEDKPKDLSLRKDTCKSKNVIQSLSRTLNKSLLPMLHNKTYFKSVATLYSTPANSQTKGEYRQSVPYAHYLNDDECVPKKDVAKPNEPLNHSENSRQALIKCNMLPMPVRVRGLRV